MRLRMRLRMRLQVRWGCGRTVSDPDEMEESTP